MTPLVEVTIRHLAMTSPDQLRRSQGEPGRVRLERVDGVAAGGVARECYALVGGAWHWTDLAALDDAEWLALLEREQGMLFVAREDEAIAGYFLLVPHDGEMELRYFGLAPSHIGRGLGGWLLTRAVEQAWAQRPVRVVLNTCTLDGPAALPNYLARGFTVVREEIRTREVA